jgi:hypothetical protein
VTFSTGLDTSRNCLSGRMIISRMAMAGDLICASGAVNAPEADG